MLAQAPIDTNTIIITASRTPETAADTAASVTVIDSREIERLREPLLPALLRLTPSAAVATAGSAGSLTEVRIRGAEANHTLLFIDGIRANDPATGNVPRFELLNSDLTSRIEVVRGPQSALWGSEAIGGVVAVETTPAAGNSITASAEAGSFGFGRASAAASRKIGAVSASLGVGWQRATGIDSFDGRGDRDGYRNLSGRASASWSPSEAVSFGASAFALTGRSEFDGFDPATFVHADTLDSSRNRLAAGRLSGRIGPAGGSWSVKLSGSLLGSSNRNLLGEEEINRTSGTRWTAGAQLEHRFALGAVANTLILAGEQERESFRARDTIYGGLSNQNRNRDHQALTAEWRAEAGPLVGDVAIRRDRFSRFADATTLRASALANLGRRFSLAGSYAQGIAQPTFFDLYGFFPGSFVGNPSLKSESSRGFELSARYRQRRLTAAVTWYRQRLKDEIVDIFDPSTFRSSTTNRTETSRRWGLEAELGWQPLQALRLTATYAFLDATEPGGLGGAHLREVRRPRHSGSFAADGESGRLNYGLSVAYTGARQDTDFDAFPARPVRLGAYWLAGARLGYRINDQVELFARAANAFDQRYQDVFGYRTEGRSVYAGIRLAPR
jgi:vitamin B12 transporter